MNRKRPSNGMMSQAERNRQSLNSARLYTTEHTSKEGLAHIAHLESIVKPKRVNRPRSPDDEPTEHMEQAAVCSWWHHYAKTKQLDPRLLVAVPNSQALLKFATNPSAFINYMKAEGMRVGMTDLVLFVARGQWHGAAFEMKRRTKGVVSEEQMDINALLVEQNYCACICHGADEAIAAITEYIEG